MGLLRLRPMWATKARVRKFAEHVTRLSAEWDPEIVQVEFSVMGQYLPALGECPAPRVLTIHDPGAESAQERAASAPLSTRAFHVMEAWAWSRFESNIIDQVDAAVAFTERDRGALRRRNSKALVTTIPLGHPVPDVSLDPVGLHPPRILFVGNFMHPPNVDAARRLVAGIFPGVQARIPDVILEIVGGDLPPDILAEAGTNVVAPGMVPDVTPYLDRAAVVVVPLHHGGGMRVKVLEAFAAGKAVVASPLAVEGMDVSDGVEVARAETDEGFATAIIRLLRDPEARVELARGARLWAERNLGWNDSVAAYEALHDDLLAARRRPAAGARAGGVQ
jgi:polysaccharide biosynthesis protein PslH